MSEIAPIRGEVARPVLANPVPARAALRGLLGIASADEAAPPAPTPAPAPDSLRREAHAAFRAVERGGERALDAGLAVLEARIRALEGAEAGRTEALKLLALYAGDDWARSVAARALRCPQAGLQDALPGFLHDPALAERERHPGRAHG